MTPRTIPLQAVRDALMIAKTRPALLVGSDGKPLARYGAYTNYPSPFGHTCRDAIRHREPLRIRTHHLGPLYRGDLDRVLQRTRMEHGLPEVRRIWGAGMRAMQAEFKSVVVQ